ncbi:MAG: N-acetylmuramoyl-L-alanine amidase, partial [Eubacteriales bacterium]
LGRNHARLDFKGVTIHNTDNSKPGADALGNVQYMLENAHTMYNSWHYTVDDHQIIRSVPENEEAMHSGSREGNHTTVGIEICQNSDGDILKATNNAAWLAANVLRRHGISRAVWKQNIFQHHDWTGKDCPSQIRRGIPYNWDTFIAHVNTYLSEPPLRRILKYRPDEPMRGSDVRAAQDRLHTLGFLAGQTDGVYGAKTAVAVRGFQTARGIDPRDGVLGPYTWSQLWL